MKYKLLCMDLDGTLLDDRKNIPLQAKKDLQEAYDRGIQIALISGRMPAGVDSIEKELGIKCIKACNAGTCIWMGDQCISSAHLSVPVMRNIYREIAQKYHLPLWIFRGREWFVTRMDAYIEQEIIHISHRPQISDVETLAKQWEQETKGPNKLLFAAEPEMIQTIYREMKEMEACFWPEIDMARSADVFLEIFPKGVDKGTALLTVCSLLHIDPKETIAAGDHELDIPMIEAAGVGVAMGNAIAELKEKADFITKTNNEAGICDALKHYLQEE